METNLFPAVKSHLLQNDELDDVCKSVESLRDHWKILGYCLGIDPSKIDAIEKDGTCEDNQMREMLAYWLSCHDSSATISNDHDPGGGSPSSAADSTVPATGAKPLTSHFGWWEPSWKALSIAVKSIDEDLAMTIIQSNSCGSDECLDAACIRKTPVGLCVQKGDAFGAADKLCDRFNELLTHARSSDLKQIITPDKLRQCLVSYLECGGFVHIPSEHHLKEINKFKWSKGIIDHLICKSLISYFNYNFLKMVFIDSYSAPSLEMIAEYSKDHLCFLNLSLEKLLMIFQDEEFQLQPPEGLPVLTLHLESKWSKRSMYELMVLLEQHTHLHINPLECLIFVSMDITHAAFDIKYAVWPCFISTVVNGFKDPWTNHNLAVHLGITINLSDELKPSPPVDTDYTHEKVGHLPLDHSTKSYDDHEALNNAADMEKELEVIETTDESVTFKLRGSQNSESKALFYRCTQQLEGDWERSQIINMHAKNETVMVKDLKPSQEYDFKLATVSNDPTNTIIPDGDKFVIQHKTSSVFPHPPGPPEVKSFKDGKAIIAWTPPQKAFKEVQYYQLSYCLSDQQSTLMPKIENCKTPEIQIQFEEENINKLYLFKLSAHYEQESSEVVEANLLALPSVPAYSNSPHKLSHAPSKPLSTPISKPGKPEVIYTCINEADQEKRLSLQWEKPKSNSQLVKRYVIEIKELDNEENCDSVKIETKTNETQHVVDTNGFTVNNMYCITIIAESCEGQRSDPSEALLHEILPPLPGSPGKPTIVAVDSNSIFVEWKKPSEFAENIDYYEVSCYTENKAKKMKHERTQQTFHMFKQLSPMTVYEISVKICSKERYTNEVFSDCIQTRGPVSSAPRSLKVTSFSHSHVVLEWDEPEENAVFVKKYMLEYLMIDPCSGSAQASYKTAGITDDKYTKYMNINKLNPGTKYFFRLFAICSDSEPLMKSQPNSIEAQTATLNPNNLKISKKPYHEYVTSSSIKLKWNSIDPSLISNYKILYYAKKTMPRSIRTEWKEVETLDAKSEFTVQNLDSSTYYYFKVQARYQSDEYTCIYGPESDVSNPIRTDAIINAPKVTRNSHEGITLSWNQPIIVQDSIEYYILKKLEGDATHHWQDVEGRFTHTKEDITGLKSGKKFCFKVSASFKSGKKIESEPSEWVCTKYPIPGPPIKPIISNITHNSLILKWNEPLETSAEFIELYTIYYINKQKNSRCLFYEHHCEASKKLEVLVDHLDPETSYIFEITPFNPDGKGGKSVLSEEITTKRKSPGQPGCPYMLRVTRDSVKLAWEKPKYPELVSYYVLYIKKLSSCTDEANWSILQQVYNDPAGGIEISTLEHSTEYLFKVIPYMEDGFHREDDTSEQSKPVKTKSAIPSQPGKPKKEAISPNSITIVWDRPVENYDKIQFYEISYHEDSGKQENEKKPYMISRTVDSSKEQHTITNLRGGKGYYFSVTAIADQNDLKSTPSLWSDLITSEKSIAAKFLTECKSISPSAKLIPVYLLNKTETSLEEKMFDIRLKATAAQKPKSGGKKIVLLVGATGTGKSTLINTIINYIMRVEYDDHFRLKLIDDPLEDKSQTKSVTEFVSSYTIHHEPGMAIPFSLTIIDTPGFGDTHGIERDIEIARAIRKFFDVENGITHIDAVGFVCKASDVRLTPTQRYIIDSIFAMFGNDVKNNIFTLCTFCDVDEPAVIEAIKEVKIPAHKYFKFNNGRALNSLPNPATHKISESFWEIGVESFKQFFSEVEKSERVNLKLTRVVMQQRETLVVIKSSLCDNIQRGMQEIEALEKEMDILKKNKSSFEQSEQFVYEMDEEITIEETLAKGEYATNCTKCKVTCHHPCKFTTNKEIVNCAVMVEKKRWGFIKFIVSLFRSKEDETICGVCPGRCPPNKHCSATFRYKKARKTRIKKSEEIVREVVNKDTDNVIVFDDVIEHSKKKIQAAFEEVHATLSEAKDCEEELNEIALIPCRYHDNIDYINILIDAETKEKGPGYEERVSQYRKLKEQAIAFQGAASSLKHAENFLQSVDSCPDLWDV